MIPWFQWELLRIGPIPIHVWGFFVALGMMAALLGIWHRAKKRGMQEERMVDLALWMIIAGFIGARFAHVFFYEPRFYALHTAEIFAVWHGGWSSFGGIIGAVAGFFLYAKKNGITEKLFLLRIADIISISALFGWMVGRVGCLMIHDHLGKPCPNCFLAIRTPTGSRLDMALLEILGLLPLAVLFLLLEKKKVGEGMHTAILFLYYGLLRFALDFFRTGDVRYGGLTPGQFFAILLTFLGGYFLIKKKKNKGAAYSAQGGISF